MLGGLPPRSPSWRGYTLLVDIGTQTGLSATERPTIKVVCAAPRWLDGLKTKPVLDEVLDVGIEVPAKELCLDRA